MKTLEEFVNEKLKETGIEIGVWSHSVLGYSCYVDTTKHDERVRAEAIRKFAEWLIKNMFNGHDIFWKGASTKPLRMADYIAEYEKEQKHE